MCVIKNLWIKKQMENSKKDKKVLVYAKNVVLHRFSIRK